MNDYVLKTTNEQYGFYQHLPKFIINLLKDMGYSFHALISNEYKVKKRYRLYTYVFLDYFNYIYIVPGLIWWIYYILNYLFRNSINICLYTNIIFVHLYFFILYTYYIEYLTLSKFKFYSYYILIEFMSKSSDKIFSYGNKIYKKSLSSDLDMRLLFLFLLICNRILLLSCGFIYVFRFFAYFWNHYYYLILWSCLFILYCNTFNYDDTLYFLHLLLDRAEKAFFSLFKHISFVNDSFVYQYKIKKTWYNQRWMCYNADYIRIPPIKQRTLNKSFSNQEIQLFTNKGLFTHLATGEIVWNMGVVFGKNTPIHCRIFSDYKLWYLYIIDAKKRPKYYWALYLKWFKIKWFFGWQTKLKLVTNHLIYCPLMYCYYKFIIIPYTSCGKLYARYYLFIEWFTTYPLIYSCCIIEEIYFYTIKNFIGFLITYFLICYSFRLYYILRKLIFFLWTALFPALLYYYITLYYWCIFYNIFIILPEFISNFFCFWLWFLIYYILIYLIINI